MQCFFNDQPIPTLLVPDLGPGAVARMRQPPIAVNGQIICEYVLRFFGCLDRLHCLG